MFLSKIIRTSPMFCWHKFTLWAPEKCTGYQKRVCLKCGLVKKTKCVAEHDWCKWHTLPCEGFRVRSCNFCKTVQRETINTFHLWGVWYDQRWNAYNGTVEQLRQCTGCKRVEKHAFKKQ